MSKKLRYLKKIDRVFDVLGGPQAVADLTGVKLKSAYHWSGNTKTFPASLYCMVQEILRERGYEAAPKLFNQRKRKKQK